MEPNQSKQQQASSPAPKDDIRDNKVMAALSYVWILSVVFLLVKKDSPFVQFHAKQGVVLFAASFILGFIPIIGWLLNIAVLVLAIMGIIAAWQGKSTKLPIISTIAEQIKM
ncbi:MAG: hypothetical protein A3E36_02675 [Candidatus Andersenbacteria bacterium RIFCSPHIGHO2_12_FULL_45_11b]|uniref:Chloroplast import component protein (Tic20) n=1 Tax=Candidatus Andersenbacteria bacterium RIFCSPHIGHO2_12_FULL_45_11b TaxID=1797282 RepID=A0A1G1XCB8_9BACT|nr:MAG: hypothetical protein A3E36_02675 [Candidatus Andersenbacteria bacterium RIFCSPHIGHO2_12_FULL_45_11b]